MKINKNSWYVKYYRRFWSIDPRFPSYRSLPISLCEFFWTMIFALLMIPMVWPSMLIVLAMDKDDYEETGTLVIFGTMLNVIFFVVGAAFRHIFDIFSLKAHGDLFIFFGIYLIGILSSCLIAAIGYLAVKMIIISIDWVKDAGYFKFEKKRSEKIVKEKKPNWFVEGVKAFIGKYCPRIDWE